MPKLCKILVLLLALLLLASCSKGYSSPDSAGKEFAFKTLKKLEEKKEEK